jgi:hypothetical protein
MVPAAYLRAGDAGRGADLVMADSMPNFTETEQRIAKLERQLDWVFTQSEEDDGFEFTVVSMQFAIACELRALRLMLREEIRMHRQAMQMEIGFTWDALASRKAPDA